MAGRKPYAGTSRRLLQVIVLTLTLTVIAVPIIIVATSGSFRVSATFSSNRIGGLLAFSFIFLSIVTGGFRPVFDRIFRPRLMQRLHVASGVVGFSIGVAHALLVPSIGLNGYNRFIVFMGTSVLALLILTMMIALMRRNFAASWRWIHRINYLLFGVIFAHAIILGSDVKTGVFLKVLFGIYAGIVVAASVYRYTTLRAIKIAATERLKAK